MFVISIFANFDGASLDSFGVDWDWQQSITFHTLLPNKKLCVGKAVLFHFIVEC